jgi:hypothetical protein
MLATLSTESQIASILDSIGCAPSNFSEIADRHANSRVIAALKGQNAFSTDDGEYYLGVARQMKKLAEEFPVPISWKETQRIKQILAARNQGPPTPFYVVLIGPLLFKRVESGNIETTTSYQQCAAFINSSVAHAAAKIIAGMGNIGVRFTAINTERRSPGTFVGTLAEVGFQQ